MTKFSLKNNAHFSGVQIVNALPCSWKRNILEEILEEILLIFVLTASICMRLINLTATNYI